MEVPYANALGTEVKAISARAFGADLAGRWRVIWAGDPGSKPFTRIENR